MSARARTSQDSTKKRFAAALTADHNLALYPDIDTPFQSETDKVHRLLPFHVFQQSDRDIDRLLNFDDIADDKPRDPAKVELRETKFALNCHRRFRRLENRFRDIRTRDGMRSHSGPDHVFLTQAVVDADRAFNAELRTLQPPTPTSKSGAKRGPPQPSGQMAFIASPLSYTGPSMPSAAGGAVMPPPPPPGVLPAAPIPVQLPNRFLKSLTSLGIVPVPAARANALTPCIEHAKTGSEEHGSTSLTINLRLLQPVQVSGLAMLLNSLVRRPPGVAPGQPPGAPGSAAGPS